MSSFSINSNLNAVSARRQLQESSNKLNDKLERLASGLRVNSASDDASGLAVSQKMTSQIKGGAQAVQNLQDGLSMLQTAQGGTQQIQENLQRVRELSVQASNDTLTNEDRSAIQEEVSELTDEIDRISEQTQFNNKNLLNGDINSENGGTEIHAGADENETISLNVEELSTDSLGVNTIDLSSQSRASDALETVDGALNQVATERADIGSAANRLSTTIDSSLIQNENQQAARSEIRDADLARETTERAQSAIRTEASTSALAQANNLEGSSALQLLG